MRNSAQQGHSSARDQRAYGVQHGRPSLANRTRSLVRVFVEERESRPTRPLCVTLRDASLHVEFWFAREADAHDCAARAHQLAAAHARREVSA